MSDSVLRTQFAADLSGYVYVGELVKLEIQLQAPTGVDDAYEDEDYADRTFVWQIYDRHHVAQIQKAPEVIVEGDDTYLRFTLTGEELDTLTPASGSVDLKHIVNEVLLSGNERVFDPAPFLIRTAGDPDATPPVSAEPTDDGASTRFTIQRGPATERILMRSVGGRGVAGAATSLEGFTVSFTDSAEWIVNHNLGHRPSATVLSPGGAEVGAQVLHISVNQLRVYFASPQSGSVRCI